jgi:hypothetical protein
VKDSGALISALDLAFKESVADVSDKSALSIDRSIFSSFNPSNPNSDNDRQWGWGQRSWSYFTIFLRILLFLSFLFFFASPKKNEKRRPENEDGPFHSPTSQQRLPQGDVAAWHPHTVQQSHFTTLLRFLLFLSLLFFFASPKKNEKRRPENEDGRFRVVLWGAVVQRGEGQRGTGQRLRSGF